MSRYLFYGTKLLSLNTLRMSFLQPGDNDAGCTRQFCFDLILSSICLWKNNTFCCTWNDLFELPPFFFQMRNIYIFFQLRLYFPVFGIFYVIWLCSSTIPCIWSINIFPSIFCWSYLNAYLYAQLEYDVLEYVVIERLAQGGRDKLKDDGLNLSDWLQSLASFWGHLYVSIFYFCPWFIYSYICESFVSICCHIGIVISIGTFIFSGCQSKSLISFFHFFGHVVLTHLWLCRGLGVLFLTYVLTVKWFLVIYFMSFDWPAVESLMNVYPIL